MKKPTWNPATNERLNVVRAVMVSVVCYIGVVLYRVQGVGICTYDLRAATPSSSPSGTADTKTSSKPSKKPVRPPTYKELANEQHTTVFSLPSLRGSITDRNHELLATSLTQPSVAVNPKQLREEGDVRYAVATLTRILLMHERDVASALRGGGEFAYVKRKASAATIKALNEALDAERLRADKASVQKLSQALCKNRLAGIWIDKEPTGKRYYPKGRLASHLLGSTGIDDNGLEGIEAQFDIVLRGKSGTLRAEVDNRGRQIPGGWSHITPADPGKTVVMTIDEPMQYVVERELASVVKKQKARGAVCIVMEVKTGDVLAMATYPNYATRDFTKVSAGLRRNRAICDSYEPGSTFKIALAAAALDSRKIGYNERFYCGNSIQVDGWTINNADDGASSPTGTEDITGIMVNSFNVGTTSVALKMGKKTYFDYLCKFGFGEQTGITLPGESEGILQPLKDWANVTLATNSFGQGVSVSPIQLVQCLQTVANKGVMMKPRIVRELLDNDGKVVHRFAPVVKRRVISEETSYQMRRILRAIVEEGTGKKAEIPGYPTAGKTGTAQVVEGGHYGKGRYIASFLGMAPVSDPRIVCLIKVEEPHNGAIWGGAVAAPVFSKVVRECLWRLGVQPVLLHPSSHAPVEKEP